MPLSAKLLRAIAKFAKGYGMTGKEGALMEALANAFMVGWKPPEGETEAMADQSALRYVRSHGGELITQISETGHKQARRIIETSVRDGLTVHETQEALIDGWKTNPARALMISRTELANALNVGESERWETEGVEHVRIVDGTEFDEACRTANGKVVTTAEYRRRPTAHPNCQRYAVPLAFDEKPGEVASLEEGD